MSSVATPQAQGTSRVEMVDSGPTFELWQGPKGALRYDWTRNGAIRMIIVGYGHAGFATPSLKHFNNVVRFTGKLSLFFDCWDMDGYDSAFRVDTSAWAQKHPEETGTCYMVTRSKMVSMAISVANLAIGGKIQSFSARAGFDIEAKKAGFALNPSMKGARPA